VAKELLMYRSRTVSLALKQSSASRFPGRQQGFLLITAVVLIVIAALLLSVMVFFSATGNQATARHLSSKQALFIAESGIEYATRQYVTSAAPCSRLTPETRSFANGVFTIADGNTPAVFNPAMSFDNVTPLPSGRCRLRATGTSGDAARRVEAIAEQGGQISLRAFSPPVGSGGSPGTNSLTIDRPAGLVAGDVMLAQLTVRNNICGAGGNTPPAGWVLITTSPVSTNGCLNSGTTISQAVYYKVAGGSEPATYTWNFNSGRSTLGLAAFSGVDNTSPINVANGQVNTSSTNIVAPGITTTVANTMLVGLFGHAHADAINPPAGMTELYDVASGAGPNGATSEAANATQAAVGATGPRTATSTGNNDAVNIGHLVALRPASGGSGGGAQIVAWREVFR
jgi:type II secretory pathway pseudopilin PulG